MTKKKQSTEAASGGATGAVETAVRQRSSRSRLVCQSQQLRCRLAAPWSHPGVTEGEP